jgi:hypothetical protein
MLTEQTVERLHHLRLAAMADAYLAQQRDPAAASLISTSVSGCSSTPSNWRATIGRSGAA